VGKGAIIYSMSAKNITIIGAGFTGIRAGLDLARAKKYGLIPDNTVIRIVSKNDYFEYYPAMYRVATGSSPLQACVRLDEIFSGYDVEIITDAIIDIDTPARTALGASGSRYKCDYMIVALGSQPTYYNISELEELSFHFRSIHGAVELRDRIQRIFLDHKDSSKEEQLIAFHFVIVGAGASGVELAGEIELYARSVAKTHAVDPSFISISLIESNNRVLGTMPEKISHRAEKRLRVLGVNLFLNRRLIKKESWTVFLQDMKIGAQTVIWTAGNIVNTLYKDLECFPLAENGRVDVDEHLMTRCGDDNIFVGGDAANTKYAGLAQTAIYDGKFIARNIIRDITDESLIKYEPKKIGYDIPIGPGWAILHIGKITIYGRIAWWMRQLIDLKFYLSILPLHKAIKRFLSKGDGPSS